MKGKNKKGKNFLKDYKLILVFLAIVVAIFIILFLINRTINANVVSMPPIGQKEVKINYSNIESELAKNDLVKKLPASAILLLSFYNFDSGSREIEKTYVIKKGSVKEGSVTRADISLSIHSKYLNSLTSGNFCSIIKQANKNGDLGVFTSKSKFSLMWKYRSVLEYKSCFGM